MRRAGLAVIAAALLPLAVQGQQPQDSARPKRRILVTSFEPFDGRPENNSTRIANAMKEHPELFPGIEVTFCVLPVVYDEGAKTALGCLDAMDPKPDMMLSLGEVGCKIQLETNAINKDDVPGAPDDAGNIRSDRTIVEGGPDKLGFDFPGQAMYCALSPEERAHVEPSTSMNYVCNNTAYRLGTAMRGTGIRYGFVHVPTAGSWCGEAGDPLYNARIIAHMLGGALAQHGTTAAATYALPHCSNDERLPTSLDELRRAAESIGDANDASACEKEYLDKLKELIR